MWDTWLYMALLGLSAGGYCLLFSSLSLPLRWLALHQLVTALTMGGALAYVFVARHHSNLFIFHGLIIVQYSLLAAMYAGILHNKALKRIALVSIPTFAFIALLIASTIQPWNQVNSYATILFNLLITFFAAAYIQVLFSNKYIKRVEREPLFWVSAGLFFTSLGNFFVQGLLNYLLQQSNQAALTVYWVEELMGMILTSLFIVALLVYKRWLFHA